MKLFSRQTPAAASEVVMFNYRRPVRTRQVALGGGGRLWLVEALDPTHNVWVWQEESSQAEAAVDTARRLSLMLN